MFIHGIGHFHPDNIIDNKFLEDLDIGTTRDWILDRVGIETRRTVLDLEYIKRTKNQRPIEAREASLYSNAQTGALATKMALERAGLTKDNIGMIVSGSCTPQYSCPAEACTIASELELEVPAFDINSACSSLAAQLNFFQMMDPTKVPDYVLILNPENNTRQIDYSDRSSAVLWGDCTTAIIVSTKVPSPFKITHTMLQSSPVGSEKVMFPSMGHFRQEGRAVQRFAIKKTIDVINEMRNKIPEDQMSSVKFIGHQANLMMLRSVCSRTEISDDGHLYNVDKFGNGGAAGCPSVLSQNWDIFQAGERIVLAVVGAGLSWGGALVEVENRL